MFYSTDEYRDAVANRLREGGADRSMALLLVWSYISLIFKRYDEDAEPEDVADEIAAVPEVARQMRVERTDKAAMRQLRPDLYHGLYSVYDGSS